MPTDYDAGYEDGHKAGYEEAEADIKKDAARVTEKGRFTLTMSGGCFTAGLTDQPGVYETSVVSAYDALGKLVARLESVRTMGRLVL